MSDVKIEKIKLNNSMIQKADQIIILRDGQLRPLRELVEPVPVPVQLALV